MQKENLFFFSFSNESTFDEVNGTNKREENQKNFEFSRAGVLSTKSKLQISEQNAKGNNQKSVNLLLSRLK